MKVKIALYQCRLKGYLPVPELKKLKKAKPDFLVLPEYFFFRRQKAKLSDFTADTEKNMAYLEQLSLNLPETLIIGGSMILKQGDKFYNTSVLYLNGRQFGQYEKQKLFGREFGDITPAEINKVFEYKGIRFSVLICADILDAGIINSLATENVRLVFVPTFSPYKEETVADKVKRDREIFIRNAEIMNAAIVKVCGVTSKYLYYSIQGRSLIAKPGQMVWQVPYHREQTEILKISCLRF